MSDFLEFLELQRVEFKLHKPASVMIPYDFKYLWNTSISYSYPDFLEGRMIARSSFPIDASREDECPSKDSAHFPWILLTLVSSCFYRIISRGVWLSLVCYAFLHCINTNGAWSWSLLKNIYQGQELKIECYIFLLWNPFHLAYYNGKFFISYLTPKSTQASVELFPSPFTLILSLWPIPSLPDCF